MEKEEKRFTRSDIITFLVALGLLALIALVFIHIRLPLTPPTPPRPLKKPTCPSEHNCTAHQCLDILGSIPFIAAMETNDPRYICCERSCICPNGGIELNGVKYTCHPDTSCTGEEVKKDLKTDGKDCCCVKV